MAEHSVGRVCSYWGGRSRFLRPGWVSRRRSCLGERVARASSLLACEGQSPWPDLDRVPAVPTQRLPRRPGEGREAHIGRALGRVAPSMLLCSLSEAICFFLGEPGQPLPTRYWEFLEAGSLLSLCTHLSRCQALRFTPGPLPPPGALTPMPAVRTFALTSGFAVLLDFLLQMSAFVALLSLDSRRQEVGEVERPRDPHLGWGWGGFTL